VLHDQERTEQVAAQHVVGVLVGHLRERATYPEPVGEDDDVDPIESVACTLGQATYERLAVEVLQR
jgi:hypothetical protein